MINYLIAGLLFIAFVIFTILVTKIDLQTVNGEKIGFASINNKVFNFFGVNNKWYKVTNYLGYIAIAVGVFFAGVGVFQLIKGKSLKAVDYKIIALGILYIIIALVYLAFEIIKINYRPIIMDGKLEASYPSSHTILTLCVLVSAMYVAMFYIKNKQLLIGVECVGLAIVIITIVGRLASGAHWFTDIIGAVLISSALIMLYIAVTNTIKIKLGM